MFQHPWISGILFLGNFVLIDNRPPTQWYSSPESTDTKLWIDRQKSIAALLASGCAAKGYAFIERAHSTQKNETAYSLRAWEGQGDSWAWKVGAAFGQPDPALRSTSKSTVLADCCNGRWSSPLQVTWAPVPNHILALHILWPDGLNQSALRSSAGYSKVTQSVLICCYAFLLISMQRQIQGTSGICKGLDFKASCEGMHEWGGWSKRLEQEVESQM